jgi:hypothetical protein
VIPPIWQRGQAGDELESLQTDVMRFFAILGLCLAAIFSLVNTALTEAPAAEPALPSPAAPAAEAAAPTPAPAPAPALERRAEPQPDGPGDDLVDSSLGDKRMASRALPVPQPKARTRPQSEPATATATATAAATPAQAGSAREPQEAPGSTPAPASAQGAPPSPPGFSLAFDSTRALEQLMQGGRVSLYALGDGAWWTAKGTRLQTAEAPARYYEMDAATVPLTWRRRAAGLPGAPAITWGVTLPPEITAAISRHTRDAEGGELLIRGSGEVALTRWDRMD